MHAAVEAINTGIDPEEDSGSLFLSLSGSVIKWANSVQQEMDTSWIPTFWQ